MGACLSAYGSCLLVYSGGGKGAKGGAFAPGGNVQGASFQGANICNSEIWPLMVKWLIGVCIADSDTLRP